MGSRTSKDASGGAAAGSPSSAAAAASSSSWSSGRVAKRCRSLRARFFGSACLRMPQRQEENGALNGKACTRDAGTSLPNGQDISEEEIKIPQPSPPSMSNSSIVDCDRLLGGNHSHLDRRTAGATVSPAPTSLNFRSRFGFFNDGVGFRAGGRAAQLGAASDSRPILSRSFSIPYASVGACVRDDSEGSAEMCCELHQDEAANIAPAGPANGTTTTDADTQLHRTGVDGRAFNDFGSRRPRRRMHEPLEGTARFSRTLSVGRLRDRVLRRTAVPEGRFVFETSEDRPSGFLHQAGGGQFLNGTGILSTSINDDSEPFPDSSANLFSGTAETSTSDAAQSMLLRETSSRDTLEQRSAFFERRRRIRSQVRALQRLGNRFESLSGHDRSCILSGQHRTGRCSCRANGRAVNSSDETDTRASISRIVMLAEALFEVLDEIHQQAVVLASRPSLSSIGSVPAPKEVVDCMPVKMYIKSPKPQTDEAAQCYICLVEYEEGDHLRILPCHHEFHQSCVDKWLKEIHRVCPLCRGDVCINDASHTEVD